MTPTTHSTHLTIVPSLYNQCKALEGQRVRIYYANGVTIRAYLRRVVGKDKILINSDDNGILRLPIGYVIKITEM